MKVIYKNELGPHDAVDALESLNTYIAESLSGTVLSMEGLSTEGFKETARHMWEQLLIHIKKLIEWVKEQLMSLRHRMERSRERVEQVMSGLGALRAHRAPFDHVVVPMSAHEYRRLSREPHETPGSVMLTNASSDMEKVGHIFFQSYTDYVKAQCNAISETMGRFNVLNADAELAELKDKLALLKIKDVQEGQPIKIVGLSTITVNNVSHPGIETLMLGTARMAVQNPDTGFKVPSVNEASAVMANIRSALTQSLNFYDQMRGQLEKLHGQLMHSGSLLMQNIKNMTEGSSDGDRIIKSVRELLKIEGVVAKNMSPPTVGAIHWVCETADAVSSLLQRALELATHQAEPKTANDSTPLPSGSDAEGAKPKAEVPSSSPDMSAFDKWRKEKPASSPLNGMSASDIGGLFGMDVPNDSESSKKEG
jgi:hypothetical protein